MTRKKKQPRVIVDPLWDWSKGVTQSALTSFDTCKDQFHNGFVKGWTKKGFQMALEFGSMFHFMDERRVSGLPPEKIAADVCKSYHDARKPALRGADYEELQLALVKVEAIFPLYCEYYKEEDAQISWKGRETQFKIPHKFTTFGGSPATVNLRGVRDGEYRTPHKNILGLFETKTKNTIDDVKIQDCLRSDFQTMMYLLALRHQYKEVPGEILYNVVRRPNIYVRKAENIHSYGERLKADIKERPEWYFRRFEVTVIPEDIDVFVQTSLDPLLRELLQWWESIEKNPFDPWASPYHSRSLSALETKYGMAALYDLMVRGRTEGYFQRSSPFPELEGSSLKEVS